MFSLILDQMIFVVPSGTSYIEKISSIFVGLQFFNNKTEIFRAIHNILPIFIYVSFIFSIYWLEILKMNVCHQNKHKEL